MNICIDLGSGMRKPEDNEKEKWYGLDIRPFKRVDYVLNVGKEIWPFEDNSVDYIKSIHLFEHFYSHELFHAMEEAHRVLKPDGYIHIEVPKAGTPAFYIHPDHKLHFIEGTFSFFLVPDNEGNIDPHGYLKGHWHLKKLEADPLNGENITAELIPNKPGGELPYTEVKRYEDI